MMRSRIVVFLLILMISIPLMISAQDDETEGEDAPTGEGEIRAIWNPEILVLINVSDEGVNVSDLSLVSEDGEIHASDFVMELDDDDMLYSLADVRPGSCLLVYLADTTPEIPETVSCTRVIGKFTPESVRDIVWAISQDGFIPTLGEADDEGEPCSINRTSCDITVWVGGPDYTADDSNPEYVDISAIWTQDVLVLINTSDFGADLSNLTLFSAVGELHPESFVMGVDDDNVVYTLEDVRPGSCLVVYLGVDGSDSEVPELPEGVECTRTISETPLENPNDMVWVIEQGGFEAFTIGSTELGCSVDATTTCDIPVPNADYVEMDMSDESSSDG